LLRIAKAVSQNIKYMPWNIFLMSVCKEYKTVVRCIY
jgi:hypothetical protein